MGIIAAWSCLMPSMVTAQIRRKVSYEVEFSTTGGRLDNNCQASGTDVLRGTMTGMELAAAPRTPAELAEAEEPTEYVGMLVRNTQISICGSRRDAQGIDHVCGINIMGADVVDVKLTIEPGQRGGYLEYLDDRAAYAQWLPPLPGRGASTVTGTCEAAEMAHMRNVWTDGQTAGSPNGQPIEVRSLPPAGAYPVTFQANPPISIWTLKVVRRVP